MEELLRRHSGEFDEAYNLLHTVDLVKGGTTYRIEIHQKMAIGYRKQFVARYFKKSRVGNDSDLPVSLESTLLWVGIPGVEAVADSPRDTLNQALIWLGIYTKQR